jgi:mycothiol system anti-sigma-R factor
VSEPDCNEALQELYVFLDGELTEERRSKIHRHLTDCSPCLGAFDFEAELKIVIARRCTDTPPPELRERIRQAILEGRLPSDD